MQVVSKGRNINVRVSEEVHAELSARAKISGMTLSAFARAQLAGSKPASKTSKLEQARSALAVAETAPDEELVKRAKQIQYRHGGTFGRALREARSE